MKLRAFQILAGAVVAAAPAPVAAAGAAVEIDGVGVRDGQVVAAVRVVGAPAPEKRGAVERGLPITVRFTVELWRDRSRWFDKQIESRVTSYRLRYDPGQRHFEVVESGPPHRRETFDTLDQAVEALSVQVLDVHPRADFHEGSSYYVWVELAIRPLTLEEFRELDNWISGRVRGEDGEPEVVTEGRDEGGFTGAVFGFFTNLAGFGDTILRARSAPFRPPELGPLP